MVGRVDRVQVEVVGLASEERHELSLRSASKDRPSGLRLVEGVQRLHSSGQGTEVVAPGVPVPRVELGDDLGGKVRTSGVADRDDRLRSVNGAVMLSPKWLPTSRRFSTRKRRPDAKMYWVLVTRSTVSMLPVVSMRPSKMMTTLSPWLKVWFAFMVHPCPAGWVSPDR